MADNNLNFSIPDYKRYLDRLYENGEISKDTYYQELIGYYEKLYADNPDYLQEAKQNIYKNLYSNTIVSNKKGFWGIIEAIIFNVLGFYVGYYLGYFSILIVKYILIDLLGQLGFLTALLSWPVEYETYALTGIIFADAAVSLYSCAFICKFGKTKLNYGCFVLGAIRVITYISSLITTIASDGFNFSSVWTIAICLIGFIVIAIGAANNEDI